jgi:adhesin/invasin
MREDGCHAWGLPGEDGLTRRTPRASEVGGRSGRNGAGRDLICVLVVALACASVLAYKDDYVQAQVASKSFLVDDFRILNDANQGDGVCATAPTGGAPATCTLRAAIQEANAVPADSYFVGVAADLDPLTAGVQSTATICQGVITGNCAVPVATFNPLLLDPMFNGPGDLTGYGDFGAWNLVRAPITFDFQRRLGTQPVSDVDRFAASFYLDHPGITLRNFSSLRANESAIVVSGNADGAVIANG